MSHFTVLVVGDNQDEQLAPFCEQTDNPEYLEFNDETEEAEEKYETEKDKYSTFEEFVSEYYGYEWNETEGGYGYYTNPRAKWDWYQLGGRWTGFFKMKQGI